VASRLIRARWKRDDRDYTPGTAGTLDSLRGGRWMLRTRNVGHLMTNPAILDRDGLGSHQAEGLNGRGMVTTFARDARSEKRAEWRNFGAGSVYGSNQVHGPRKSPLRIEIFTRVETALGLPANRSNSASW